MEGLVKLVNNLVLSSISNIMVFSMDFSTVAKKIFGYFRYMYFLNQRKFKQCDRFIFSQIYTVPYTYFWIVYFCCISIKLHNCQNASHSRNCILFWKLFWPAVRKNCSGDREKRLKFEAEGQEFSKLLRSLEQFIQRVKYENNFFVTEYFFNLFMEVSQS